MNHITPELVEKCRLLVLASFHVAMLTFVASLIVVWVAIAAKALVYVLTQPVGEQKK